LEQSHGVPPVSVALDHTTLKEEGSCGYSSVKTARSIDYTSRTVSKRERKNVLPRIRMNPQLKVLFLCT
jgi:hypothetical protein